jgi:nucleotidyltransferase substrate binding protein (TIGR01987 family)
MALEKKTDDFSNALARLVEAYEKAVANPDDPSYSFFRDSAIQRFEFTLEIAWKTVKTFLLQHEGIECRSPKGCIREYMAAGYLTPEQTTKLLKMIDDRNLVTHTYHEAVAETIFEHLGGYIALLSFMLKQIKAV